MHYYALIFTEKPGDDTTIAALMEPFNEYSWYDKHYELFVNGDYEYDGTPLPKILWDYYTILETGPNAYYFNLASEVTDHRCTTVVLPNGEAKVKKWFDGTEWHDFTQDFVANVEKIFREHPNWYVTAVDYHH